MKKILVIDDEEWLREMIQMALSQKGYEVVEAENGEVGIAKAQKVIPDLILCDVNMGKVNGYLTLSSLRGQPDTAAIPFILMTGAADNAGMRQGMELGADDYLPKPFTIDNLYAAVETRLKKAQALRDEADKRLADLRDNITMMLPHELKTPLNGILAYGEMLKACQESPLPPEEIAEMGQTICESGRRLERLIENFLIYSQIEMMESDPGRTAALRKKQTPLPRKIVEESAARQAESAGRPADLVLELSDKPSAISDEYLSKIVDELTLNAFKFSKPGTPIQVSLTAPAGELVLVIADKGAGMSADQIRNVGLYGQFDRKKREQQGLGFGLIIAKKLAELHAGKFAIESEVGAGTKVTVKLPLAGLN